MNADPKKYVFLIYIGLVFAAILAFGQVVQNDFIGYDDPENITENSYVKNGLTWNGISWAFTSTLMHNVTPLAWLSHMLDCQLFGLKPQYHHLVSLFFHVITSMLLFSVLKKSTGALWPSAFAAAVFAVHPLNVETVAWVSERTHILGGLFWMLTLAAYISYVRSGSKRTYLLTIILFELGIMSKATVVTLPLVLFALDYWPLGRFLPLAGDKPTSRAFWGLVKEKIPFFVLALIPSIMTFFLYKAGGLMWSFEKLSPLTRILNVFVAYVRYIGKIIWPVNLAVLYPYPRNILPLWQPLICFAALAAVAVLVWRFAKRSPYLVAGWIWFLLALVPVIGLLQVGIQAIADRYAYIPSIGIVIMITWAAAELPDRKYLSKKVCAALAAVCLVSLTLCSRTQVKYWEDTFTLYEHTLAVTEDNYFVRHNYASELEWQGRLDEAVVQFKEALRINPRYYSSSYYLGRTYMKQGKLDLAEECFRQVLNIVPGHPDANYRLATILTGKGEYDEAMKHLYAALNSRPMWPDVYYEMARIFYFQGKPEYTIQYCLIAVAIAPDYFAPRLTAAHTLGGNGTICSSGLPLLSGFAARPQTCLYPEKSRVDSRHG